MTESRHLDSWTEGFLAYTEGTGSPKLFRKWTALTTIGACLERRVWTETSKGFAFPNFFVILCGPPGTGKTQAINAARALVRATEVEGVFKSACLLAPTDVTKGALLDYLSLPSVTRLGPDPLLNSLGREGDHKYHSAFLAVSELGDLVKEHDNTLLSLLHSLFDCLPIIEEERRYRSDKPIKLHRGQLSLLAGTTPAYLSRAFPPAAWNEGFMARTLLVYSHQKIPVDLFDKRPVDLELAGLLTKDLRQIGKMRGQMVFTDGAKEAIRAWIAADYEPKPKHIRMEHYNTRRELHALKLCQIAAADKGNLCMIDVEDFQQALAWLIEAEQAMPQFFMELSGSSDDRVTDELFYYLLQLWESPLHGKRPIKKAFLMNFLRRRVVEWRIEKVIETAWEAELIIKCPIDGEDYYKPNMEAALIKAKKK